MANKGRKHMKKYTKKQAIKQKKGSKYTRSSNRRHKRHMKGGMRPLNPQSVSEPIFVPKGVPFVPPGGGSQYGNAFPHKYYTLAQPSLHAPNNFLQQGGGNPLVQLGRNIMYNIEHLYNTFRADPTTITQDPNVLKQPIENERPNYDLTPLDVNEIQATADAKVADFKPEGV